MSAVVPDISAITCETDLVYEPSGEESIARTLGDADADILERATFDQRFGVDPRLERRDHDRADPDVLGELVLDARKDRLLGPADREIPGGELRELGQSTRHRSFLWRSGDHFVGHLRDRAAAGDRKQRGSM